MKRMRHNQEVSHTPWLAAWNNLRDEAILVLNRIAGILTETEYQMILSQFAADKKKAMSINLGDHPDDDEEDLAKKRASRAIRRRTEIDRQAKATELALHVETSKTIEIGLKEFLLFARESELKRLPTLLNLLASDFKVTVEDDEEIENKNEPAKDKRIQILRRRLGLASKKKYALLRWKGLAPPQKSNAIKYNARPTNLLIRKKTDPHPHPNVPILRIALLLTDTTHMKGVVYVMKRVAHRMRLQIEIHECLTVEKLVTELVQNESNSSSDGGINLCFIQDELPGMSADQLKRSLELSKVAVPTVFVTSPESTPPVFGLKKHATRGNGGSTGSRGNIGGRSSFIDSSSFVDSSCGSTSSRSSSSNAFPPTTESINGHNHQLPFLVHALEQDPLGSYPGHHGAGCENTVGVPWTIICMPFTRQNLLKIFQQFWLPLQSVQFRPRSTLSTRAPPPNCKQFLGKSAADTLQFQHKTGLGVHGICTWYASQQHSIVRNVPSIEKQWMLDADASLHGGKKLHFGSSTHRGGRSTKKNVLFDQKVKVQKAHIARRMQEHINAQSKIVLDLLPGR